MTSTDRDALLETLRREMRRSGGGFGDAGLRAYVPTGVAALDEALPGGGLPAGALTEIFAVPGVLDINGASGAGAAALACVFARAALNNCERLRNRYVAWIDTNEFYPPAAAALGLDPARILIVRPAAAAGALAAFELAIRSPAIAASAATLTNIPLPVARRLQLASEAGGGLALLIRPDRESGAPSAAAVRLRAAPFVTNPPSVTTVFTTPAARRIGVEILKARGGLVHHIIFLEINDANGAVRGVAEAAVGSRGERRGALSA